MSLFLRDNSLSTRTAPQPQASRRGAAAVTRRSPPPEALPSLIGTIYDAALDPTLWPDTLTAIGGFAGGQKCGLNSKDAISKLGVSYHHAGFDPHYVRTYTDTYNRFDPLAALFRFDVGIVVSTPQMQPYDEFLHGRFFNEWMRPQHLVDAACVVLEKSATSLSLLAILYDKATGMVDDERRRRFSAVVPHVRRALQVSKTIDHKTVQAATLADALDGLSAGVILVGAGDRIVHANAAAQAMLAAGDVLRSSGGQLLAGHRQSERDLSAAIQTAAGGTAEIPTASAMVTLTARDGGLFIAHVVPMTAGARRDAGTAPSQATVAVLVRKAEMSTPSRPEIIARTYDLTPTELRVMLAIVDAGGVRETAESLGIGEGTVKTHLHRLYGKTGTARQADLVKLVAGFSSPLMS